MSTFNIRTAFSYTISQTNIDYVRNYNFNTSSISELVLQLNNSDTEVPITVNMSTTDPWVRIVDPSQPKVDLKYPKANLVLQPTQSKTLSVRIDLPPEIESRPETVIYPSITMELLSGSFPVNGATDGKIRDQIVASVDRIVFSVGDIEEVSMTAYDTNGNPLADTRVVWTILDTSIAEFVEEDRVKTFATKKIKAKAAGSTSLRLESDELSIYTSIPIRVLGGVNPDDRGPSTTPTGSTSTTSKPSANPKGNTNA